MNGYVTDTAYPARVHREIAPAWLHAVATALGQAAADPRRAFTWCELGCGNGLNAALLAAANPDGRFIAVDVNPAHVEHGRRLAASAGLGNLEFHQTDFATLAQQPQTLGAIDFLVCHGVWSWVDEGARQALLTIASRQLAPAGLLYLGYMSHPGASPMAGVQQLLYRRAQALTGDSASRASTALAWLRQLAEAGLGSFTEHPGLRRQLAAMAHEHPAQIAHEFLTPHWQPQHAGEVITRLAEAGLDYIGSADPLDNIDTLSLPGDVQPRIAAITDTALRETAKDAARNQSLRRDLYQRGGHALAPAGHRAALDAITFAARPNAPVGGGLTLDTRIGPVPAPAELVGPALAALATRPHTFAELAALPAYAGRAGLLNVVLQTLLWAGCAHPLPGNASNHHCVRLNAGLERTGSDHGPCWYADPALGNAFPLRR